MPLPLEITVNGQTTRSILPSEGIMVNASTPPQVDAKGYYLKKVTLQ